MKEKKIKVKVRGGGRKEKQKQSFILVFEANSFTWRTCYGWKTS